MLAGRIRPSETVSAFAKVVAATKYMNVESFATVYCVGLKDGVA